MPRASVRWHRQAADQPWPSCVDASIDRFAATRAVEPPDSLDVTDIDEDEVLCSILSIDPDAQRGYRIWLRVRHDDGAPIVDVCSIERASG